jgi:hypothetical protein
MVSSFEFFDESIDSESPITAKAMVVPKGKPLAFKPEIFLLTSLSSKLKNTNDKPSL